MAERKKGLGPALSKVDFKQQRLGAYQPIITARTVWPMFLVVGVLFVILGTALHFHFSTMKEFSVHYTNCKNRLNQSQTCADYLRVPTNLGTSCHCEEKIQLDKIDSPVYVYYGLSNFYQNHRVYVRSRDDDQLRGDPLTPEELHDNCEPFKATVRDGKTVGYAPCGKIANSLFNDTFNLDYMPSSGSGRAQVGLLKTGIAWSSDKRESKFNNPDSWTGFVRPEYWTKDVWDLDPQEPSNNGYENEDLIVWMRLSAMPTFIKMFRRVNHEGVFSTGLPAGEYTIDITYNYPVTSFGGTKRVLIGTSSILGGKNTMIGPMYIFLGFLCIMFGCLFLYIRNTLGKKITAEGVIDANIKVVDLPHNPLTSNNPPGQNTAPLGTEEVTTPVLSPETSGLLALPKQSFGGNKSKTGDS